MDVVDAVSFVTVSQPISAILLRPWCGNHGPGSRRRSHMVLNLSSVDIEQLANEFPILSSFYFLGYINEQTTVRWSLASSVASQLVIHFHLVKRFHTVDFVVLFYRQKHHWWNSVFHHEEDYTQNERQYLLYCTQSRFVAVRGLQHRNVMFCLWFYSESNLSSTTTQAPIFNQLQTSCVCKCLYKTAKFPNQTFLYDMVLLCSCHFLATFQFRVLLFPCSSSAWFYVKVCKKKESERKETFNCLGHQNVLQMIHNLNNNWMAREIYLLKQNMNNSF